MPRIRLSKKDVVLIQIYPIARWILTGAMLLMALTANGFAEESATAKLEEFHSGLTERYPDVSHVSPDELLNILPDDTVLFDVREVVEFEVSHIKGFVRKYGSQLKDKKVIFYCSVGERSSRLAQRVAAQLTDQQSVSVYNLEGGIFRWHNDYNTVVSQVGETEAVHPFNRKWGQLLERQDMIRMRPESK